MTSFNYRLHGREDRFECRSLTEETLDEAIALYLTSMRQENVALGVGMFDQPGTLEEMETVFREIIKDGCSIVAVDVDSKEVVGVVFNKLHARLATGREDPFEVFIKKNVTMKPCLGLIDFLNKIEAEVDLFEKYNATALMEIFYVGTASKCRSCGVGQLMVEASLDLGRRLLRGKDAKTAIGNEIALRDVVPEVAFGVFTSSISQRIAEKFNFDWLAAIHYDDYLYDGRKLSQGMSRINEAAKLGAVRL